MELLKKSAKRKETRGVRIYQDRETLVDGVFTASNVIGSNYKIFSSLESQESDIKGFIEQEHVLGQWDGVGGN